MASCVAFGFQRGRIRVAAVEKDAAIVLLKSYKIDIDDGLQLPALMDRYKRDVENVLDNYAPDSVAIKLVFETNTIAGAKGSSLPCGIVALTCFERQLRLHEYTSASFRHPKPFGMPDDAKPLEEVEVRFGAHPPYWDKLQKEVILAAWRSLL